MTAGEAWARPVVHWAIEARDPEAQKRFYAALFGWEIGDGPFLQIAPGLGGPEPGPAGHIQQGEQSRIGLYVQVGDLAASLVRVVELGGAALSGGLDVPGGPTIAFAADPEGNPLTFVQA